MQQERGDGGNDSHAQFAGQGLARGAHHVCQFFRLAQDALSLFRDWPQPVLMVAVAAYVSFLWLKSRLAFRTKAVIAAMLVLILAMWLSLVFVYSLRGHTGSQPVRQFGIMPLGERSPARRAATASWARAGA